MARRGRVTFDQDRCKGCGLCISVCPVKILALDSERVNKAGYVPATVIDGGRCIACVNCAVMCPDGVITVERLTEVRT